MNETFVCLIVWTLSLVLRLRWKLKFIFPTVEHSSPFTSPLQSTLPLLNFECLLRILKIWMKLSQWLIMQRQSTFEINLTLIQIILMVFSSLLIVSREEDPWDSTSSIINIFIWRENIIRNVVSRSWSKFVMLSCCPPLAAAISRAAGVNFTKLSAVSPYRIP